MASADAQAFKRACSCFGLGRHFYDFPAIWVDLDQNRQPVNTPVLSAWAQPQNWRKGIRPQGKNGNGSAHTKVQEKGSRGGNSGGHGKAVRRLINSSGTNGRNHAEKSNGSDATNSDNDLDQRTRGMEKAVGTAFYQNILRDYGRVNQPKLILDVAVKQKVLQILESVARGIDRLEAVLKRIDPNTVQAVLTKLQVSSLGQIADIKTLQNVVLGLENLARSIEVE